MNTQLIREKWKFQILMKNKNASGILRCINDMVIGRVFTI